MKSLLSSHPFVTSSITYLLRSVNMPLHGGVSPETIHQRDSYGPQHKRFDTIRMALRISKRESRSLRQMMSRNAVWLICIRLTHEPPNTCHFSILRCSRIFSVSFTRSQVVFSSRHAVLFGIGGQVSGQQRRLTASIYRLRVGQRGRSAIPVRPELWRREHQGRCRFIPCTSPD